MSIQTPANVASAVGDAARHAAWSRVAAALHSLDELPARTSLVWIDVTGHAPVVIDPRHRAFWWATPMFEFPEDPAEAAVYTEPITHDAPPPYPLPGRHLDALLWAIGIRSFDGGPAWWLDPGDRFRLTRWPNLTELVHSVDQMRMTALLGNAYLGADELAAAAGVDRIEAQRLLNAYSLIGILRSAPRAETAAPVIAVASPGQRGIMSRLRERLGL